MKEESRDIKSLLNEAAEKSLLKFDDARIPTEKEERNLAKLMYCAFCKLRILTAEGRNQQAHDLADAFDNVPLVMHRDDFSFRLFCEFLRNYQKKYPPTKRFDYLQAWEKLIASIL